MHYHPVSPQFVRKTLAILYNSEETAEGLLEKENELKVFLVSEVHPAIEENGLFPRLLASQQSVDAFLSEEERQKSGSFFIFCNDTLIKPLLHNFDRILRGLLGSPLFGNYLSKDKTLLFFLVETLTDRVNNAFFDFRPLFRELVARLELLFHSPNSLQAVFEALFVQFETLFTAFKCLRKMLIRFFFYRPKGIAEDVNDSNAQRYFLRLFFKRLPPFLHVFFSFVTHHLHGSNNRELLRVFIAAIFDKMVQHLPTGLVLIGFDYFSCLDPKKIAVILENMAVAAKSHTFVQSQAMAHIFDTKALNPLEFAQPGIPVANPQSMLSQPYAFLSVDRHGLLYFLKTIRSFDLEGLPALENLAGTIQNLEELRQNRIYVFTKLFRHECVRCQKALKMAENIETIFPDLDEHPSRSFGEALRHRKLSAESYENTVANAILRPPPISSAFENHLSEELRHHFLMDYSAHLHRLSVLSAIQARLAMFRHLSRNCFAIKKRLRTSVAFKFVSAIVEGGKFGYTLKLQKDPPAAAASTSGFPKSDSGYQLSLLEETQEHVLRQSSVYDENFKIRNSDFKLIEITRLKDSMNFFTKERFFWRMAVHPNLRQPIALLLQSLQVQTQKYLALANLENRFGIGEEEVIRALQAFTFAELVLYLSKSRHTFFIESFHWPSVFLIQQHLPLSPSAFQSFLAIKSSQEETRRLRKTLSIDDLKYFLSPWEISLFFGRFEKAVKRLARDLLDLPKPTFKAT